ncbi:hypothetical protein AgCh_012694 [Apium graveolens]
MVNPIVEDIMKGKSGMLAALGPSGSGKAPKMFLPPVLCNGVTYPVLYEKPGGERRHVKSLVVGRPILLALEDVDGGSSFLEKALQFLEKYGTKVEGILRQAADVEEVDHRVQEYEHGKVDFGEDEDAHLIGDSVKDVVWMEFGLGCDCGLIMG